MAIVSRLPIRFYLAVKIRNLGSYPLDDAIFSGALKIDYVAHSAFLFGYSKALYHNESGRNNLRQQGAPA
jgi:hypothetical protein